MEQEKNVKSKNITAIIVLIIAAIILATAITNVVDANREKKDNAKSGYYIGETMRYEDIEITVTDVTSQRVDNEYSEYNGFNEIKIYFTYKNDGKEDFTVNPSNVTIKTEDKGEVYNYTSFSASKGILGIFSSETIIAGTDKTYNITFYTPYSLQAKKFSVVFCWGILYDEQEYHLYQRTN